MPKASPTLNVSSSSNSVKSAGRWDSIMKGPTAMFGGSALPKPVTPQEQLSIRRQLDNKIRYGQPVTEQEMQYGRDTGAIAGGYKTGQNNMGLGNLSYTLDY